jgi:hypothetical protein
MIIRRITLTPESLSALPNDERALLHVVGHALNEMNVVLKLFLLASNYDFEPPVVRHAQLCQTMVLSKLLVGKVHEIWMVLQKGYFGTGLSKTYMTDLEPEHLDALKSLKKYFGRKNLIESVRNQFAFHYSLEHGTPSPALDTPPEALAIYFGTTVGNSLYQFAEQSIGMAMLHTIDASDPQSAYDRLFMETREVAFWLDTVGQGILFSILERHTSLTSRAEELASIDLGAVPQSTNVRIPFFFEVTISDVERS